MEKIKWKSGAMLSPVPPVMVTCKNGDKTNIITIAWTGILATTPPTTYISVRPERYSYEMIRESGEFVINLTTAELVRKADMCGMTTGAKKDKFKDTGLTAAPSTEVGAPSIAESPLSIECKVRERVELGSHDMFIADIVAITVAKDLIDESGKLHLEKAHLVAYSHGEYFELGKKIGKFGFSVRKRKNPMAPGKRRKYRTPEGV